MYRLVEPNPEGGSRVGQANWIRGQFGSGLRHAAYCWII